MWCKKKRDKTENYMFRGLLFLSKNIHASTVKWNNPSNPGVLERLVGALWMKRCYWPISDRKELSVRRPATGPSSSGKFPWTSEEVSGSRPKDQQQSSTVPNILLLADKRRRKTCTTTPTILSFSNKSLWKEETDAGFSLPVRGGTPKLPSHIFYSFSAFKNLLYWIQRQLTCVKFLPNKFWIWSLLE